MYDMKGINKDLDPRWLFDSPDRGERDKFVFIQELGEFIRVYLDLDVNRMSYRSAAGEAVIIFNDNHVQRVNIDRDSRSVIVLDVINALIKEGSCEDM